MNEAALAPPPAPRVRTRSLEELPGPRGLPLIGNIHEIDTRELHLVLERWAERYGPVYRFGLGPRPVVVISDPEAAGEILRRRPGDFRRPRSTAVAGYEIGFNGVFAAEGEDWRRQRRLVIAALNSNHLNRHFEVIERASRRLYRRLLRESDNGAPVDMLAVLTCFTVDVTSELAFGFDLDTLGGGGNELQGHITRTFEMLARRSLLPVPYWRWLKLPADRAVDRSVEYLRLMVQSLIEDARRRLHASPELRSNPGNFLEAMLVAQEDGDFTDREIAGNVFTLLLAGEDTTANTMAWALWLLSTDADAQAAWAAEAHEVLGDGHALAAPEAADRLPYGDAVLREAMRLKGVAPIIGLESLGDTVAAGVRMPAGTRIFLLTRAIGVAGDPAFDPERWLADGHAPDRKSFLAFGAGPRFCPGRNLAILEAKAAMATIAHGFEIEAMKLDSIRERFGFVMQPEGLRLRLRLRRADP